MVGVNIMSQTQNQNAEKSAELLGALSRAFDSDYVQGHPQLQRNLLDQARRLNEDEQTYPQVADALALIIRNELFAGGVHLDPDLVELASLTQRTPTAQETREKGFGMSAAMFPVWFGHS